VPYRGRSLRTDMRSSVGDAWAILRSATAPPIAVDTEPGVAPVVPAGALSTAAYESTAGAIQTTTLTATLVQTSAGRAPMAGGYLATFPDRVIYQIEVTDDAGNSRAFEYRVDPTPPPIENQDFPNFLDDQGIFDPAFDGTFS